MMVLTAVWFVLIAVLWAVYLVLEGFDFGVGMLIHILGKNPQERTATVRTIGPHWDGNEVWLIAAGGAMFAAFPLWYATMFSGMYLALFLLLVLLIVRIMAIEWRSKIHSDKWVRMWDWTQTVAAFGVPLVLGVAFSNLVSGMQIEAQQSAIVDGRLTMTTIEPGAVAGALNNGDIVFHLTGGFFSLFTFYSIWGGLTLVTIFLAHGTQFLSLKTEGDLQERATNLSGPASIVALVFGAVWVIWGQIAYSDNTLSWIPLVIAAIGLIIAAAYSQPAVRNEARAFAFSSVGIVGAAAWIFSTMAPYVMKSAIAPEYSLTMEWASSTQSTLTVMTIVAVVLVPVVVGYTIWSYWVFRGRIATAETPTPSGLLPDAIRMNANFLTGKKG